MVTLCTTKFDIKKKFAFCSHKLCARARVCVCVCACARVRDMDLGDYVPVQHSRDRFFHNRDEVC
jgi:hypothetical protein